MKTKKTEFQITVGYKAVVNFIIKAENEDEAKKIILERIKNDGIYLDSEIQDENYAADGVLNMDRTYNELYK